MNEELFYNNNSNKNVKKEPKTCSICFNLIKKMNKWDRLTKGLSTVVLKPEIITLKCKHKFHANCILQWLKINKTCPNCRQNV